MPERGAAQAEWWRRRVDTGERWRRWWMQDEWWRRRDGLDETRHRAGCPGAPAAALLCVEIENELSAYPGGSPGPPRRSGIGLRR